VDLPTDARSAKVGPVLAMELVEGPTLADRIAVGPVALDEVLPIARQIAEALEAAHGQGIIHRDLKPANIKLRPDGSVKVLDLELAKTIENERLGQITLVDLPVWRIMRVSRAATSPTSCRR